MWKSVGHRGCKLASRFYHSHCSLAIIKLIAEFLLTMLIHTDTQSYITNFFFFFGGGTGSSCNVRASVVVLCRLSCSIWDFPDQGPNPGHLPWEQRVLPTGWQGSPSYMINLICTIYLNGTGTVNNEYIITTVANLRNF